VLTGLEWTWEHHPDCRWMASFPTDAPFLPRDLVARMLAAVDASGADMACATSGGRAHPVVGLWPVRLAVDLRRAMVDEEMRKVDVWTARYRLEQVAFQSEPVDPFFNTNRPEDLDAAETLLDEGADRY
jgi:molybdopterin-guanine dinucleotide biosynthesis protein A